MTFFSADFALFQFCRWQHQIPAGGMAPRPGDRGMSPSSMYHLERVASDQLRCVLQAHPIENVGPSAFCLRALPAAVVLQSVMDANPEACVRLVKRQHAFVFRLQPIRERDCIRGDRQNILALNHDLWALVGVRLAQRGTGFGASILPQQRALHEEMTRCFMYCIPFNHSKKNLSTWILANGAAKDPEAYSPWMGR